MPGHHPIVIGPFCTVYCFEIALGLRLRRSRGTLGWDRHGGTPLSPLDEFGPLRRLDKLPSIFWIRSSALAWPRLRLGRAMRYERRQTTRGRLDPVDLTLKRRYSAQSPHIAGG
ncbi:hypothetical protein FJTKL_00070 [Diaporthe vaccinii]|uniref:Uncharacterized protein n=1 Tax=Diaporthe vaccinii TaxID=105482 RepID=A0ABR4E4M6_9PEZI